MPIQITDQLFQNSQFTNSYNQYTANAGDRTYCVFSVRTAMRVSSVDNPLSLDYSLNQITSPAVSWLDEGFRVGNTVQISKYNSTGLVYGYYRDITFVDDTHLDLNGTAGQWYDVANNEMLVITVVNSSQDPSPKQYTNMEFLINHSLSGQLGNSLSLIDGEPTRVLFENIDTLSTGGALTGLIVPNQSGQFLINAFLVFTGTNNDGFNKYSIQTALTQSGVYDQAWFAQASYLKLFAQFSWQPQPQDPYPPSTVIYDEVANTGWFNEKFNVGVSPDSMVQNIPELDYCVPSVHEVIIDSQLTDGNKFGIGGCYISIDDNYYKNKTYPQQNITMCLPTTRLVVGQTFASAPNNDPNYLGAGYDISINSVAIGGGQVKVNFTFTPNALFNTFMENRDDGDKLFYLWVTVGEVNFLAFDGQLKCDPPVGGALGLTTNFGFLDHGQNITQIGGSKQGFVANTEDDCAWYGTFLLDNNQVYDRLTMEIEVFNGTSQDDFGLQSSQFSFGGLQINSAGQYLINETLPIVSTLPSNSAKINALFKRVPAMDTATQYGVSVYYPFLLNWQYWLEQQNASTDFYPTQNRNWEQYDDIPAWEIRYKISLIKDGLAFINSNVIRDLPYDSSTVIDQDIQMFIESTGQNVQVIAIGNIMRIVATHTINDGRAWDPNDTWGMITVEPFESTVRTICSSVLPFDNDLSNPLRPINGVQMIITYPTQNVAKMECFFNPDIINLANGAKFTTKIKGCPTSLNTNGKRTTDGTLKTTSGLLTTEIKTLAI